MKKNDLLVTVVIIVKNDKRIENTINRLLQSTLNKFEIVVVDASDEYVKYKIPEYSNLTWINYSISEDRRPIPDQRNVGIENSNTDCVVFIDADCIPEKDWLENLTEPILNNRELACAGKINCINASDIHTTFFLSHTEDYLTEVPTMNFAFHKSLIKQIGYFNTNLQYGEDVDFCWRLENVGVKIKYVANAVISHDFGEFRHDIRRMFYYGKARPVLHKLHPKKLRYALHEYYNAFYPISVLFLPLIFYTPWYGLIIILVISRFYNAKKPLKFFVLKSVNGMGVIKGIFSLKT